MKVKRKPVHGILLLDKPQGLTSNQALQKVRNILAAEKAGHTGSLDPMATGMLPLCFGEASKFAQYGLEANKSYEATMCLGISTTTADATGDIVEQHEVPEITHDDLGRVQFHFKGEQQQIPPMYSALKQNGVPLYRLARRGENVERKPRSITIFDLALQKLNNNHIQFNVSCSKGTYVRTLAEDIARILVENGKTITYMLYEEADEDNLRLFLLGSAMGALLQQRGFIVLHGNAISTNEKNCEIFVGRRGAGKSTTAAWHYLHGAKILADDVCAIGFGADGHPYVLPSYPQLKLWQASADLLKIQTQNLRQLRKQDAKFALVILDNFFKQPLPVSQIIEINKDSLGTKNLYGAEKLTVLIKHSYRYNFLRRMGMGTNYRKSLMQLADKVQVSSKNRINIKS